MISSRQLTRQCLEQIADAASRGGTPLPEPAREVAGLLLLKSFFGGLLACGAAGLSGYGAGLLLGLESDDPGIRRDGQLFGIVLAVLTLGFAAAALEFGRRFLEAVAAPRLAVLRHIGRLLQDLDLDEPETPCTSRS